MRKPRADAERNRQRLLEAARAAFLDSGPSASLEDIARQAGVGIGTLYRHFPTREALVGEIYRVEVENLGQAAKDLANAHPPLEALRRWLLQFVDYFSTKIVLLDAIKSAVGAPTPFAAPARDILTESSKLLVDRAVAAGDIRDMGMDPVDLLRALTGLAAGSAGTGWRERATAMIDLLIAGLKRS